MFTNIKKKLRQFTCLHQNVREIGSDNKHLYVECTICGKKDWIYQNDIIYKGKYIHVSYGRDRSWRKHRFRLKDEEDDE